jgi:hypothetical protein
MVLAGIAGLCVTMTAAPAVASAGHNDNGASSSAEQARSDGPPGSNGTIKIDEVPVDDGMDNDAHVGCTMAVKFFGFDGGAESARMVFSGKQPTGGGTLLDTTSSWTAPARTAGNDLDQSVQVDLTPSLSSLTPATQGYHVALTVDVTEPNGRIVTKHKVFWAGPCSAAPAASAIGGAPGSAGTTGMRTAAPGSLPATGEGAAAAGFAIGAASFGSIGQIAGTAAPVSSVLAAASLSGSSVEGLSLTGSADSASPSSATPAAATVAAASSESTESTPSTESASTASTTAASSAPSGVLAGPRVLAADITRAAELPFTGSSTVLHLLAAALLIAAGAGCVIIGRRRAA